MHHLGRCLLGKLSSGMSSLREEAEESTVQLLEQVR